MINDTWIQEDGVDEMERVAVRLWVFFFKGYTIIYFSGCNALTNSIISQNDVS